MERYLIAPLLTLLVASSIIGAGMPPRVMTSGMIEEAIAFGRDHKPQPYALHPTTWSSLVHSSVTNAILYTPFIRVAMASYVATREGRSLSLAQIDKTLVDPLVYVAVRRGLFPSLPYTATDLNIYLTAPGRSRITHDRINPVWKRSAAPVLSSFERDRDVEAFAFVAAFSLDAVRPGLEVFIEAKTSRGDRYFTATFIGEDEFDKWR